MSTKLSNGLARSVGSNISRDENEAPDIETPHPPSNGVKGVWSGIEKIADNIADKLPLGNNSYSFDGTKSRFSIDDEIDSGESGSDSDSDASSSDSDDSSMYSFGNTTFEFAYGRTPRDSAFNQSILSSVSDSAESKSTVVRSGSPRGRKVPQLLQSKLRSRTAHSAITCDVEPPNTGKSSKSKRSKGNRSVGSISLRYSYADDSLADEFLEDQMECVSPFSGRNRGCKPSYHRKPRQLDRRSELDNVKSKANADADRKALSPRSQSKLLNEQNSLKRKTSAALSKKRSFDTEAVRELAASKPTFDEENEIVFGRSTSMESTGLFNDGRIWNRGISPKYSYNRSVSFQRKRSTVNPVSPTSSDQEGTLAENDLTTGQISRIDSSNRNDSERVRSRSSKWDKRYDDLCFKVEADGKELKDDLTDTKALMSTISKPGENELQTSSSDANSNGRTGLASRLQRIKDRQKQKQLGPERSTSLLVQALSNGGASSRDGMSSSSDSASDSSESPKSYYETQRNFGESGYKRCDTMRSNKTSRDTDSSTVGEEASVVDRFRNHRRLASLSTYRVRVPEAEGEVEVERRSPRGAQFTPRIETRKPVNLQDRRKALFRKARSHSPLKRFEKPAKGAEVQNLRSQSLLTSTNRRAKQNLGSLHLPILAEESRSHDSLGKYRHKPDRSNFQHLSGQERRSLMDADEDVIVSTTNDARGGIKTSMSNTSTAFSETITMDGNRSYSRIDLADVKISGDANKDRATNSYMEITNTRSGRLANRRTPDNTKKLGSIARPIEVDPAIDPNIEVEATIPSPLSTTSALSIKSIPDGEPSPKPIERKYERKNWKRRVGRKINKLTAKLGRKDEAQKQEPATEIESADNGNKNPSTALDFSQNSPPKVQVPAGTVPSSTRSLPVLSGNKKLSFGNPKIQKGLRFAHASKPAASATSTTISKAKASPARSTTMSDTCLTFNSKKKPKISLSRLNPLKKSRENRGEATPDHGLKTELASEFSAGTDFEAENPVPTFTPIPDKLPTKQDPKLVRMEKVVAPFNATSETETLEAKIDRVMSLKSKRKGSPDEDSSSSDDTDLAYAQSDLESLHEVQRPKKSTLIRIGNYQCTLPESKSTILDGKSVSKLMVGSDSLSLNSVSVTDSEQASTLLTPQSTCQSTKSGIARKSRDETLAKVEKKLRERLAVDVKMLAAIQSKRKDRSASSLDALEDLAEVSSFVQSPLEKESSWTRLFRKVFSCNGSTT